MPLVSNVCYCAMSCYRYRRCHNQVVKPSRIEPNSEKLENGAIRMKKSSHWYGYLFIPVR